MVAEFDQWNEVKKKVQDDIKVWTIKNREIYWLKVGKNIGYESFGKNKEFLRPVMVLKKFLKDLFIGLPMTTKIKENKYYFSFFPTNKNKENALMLSQIRVFSTKRIKSKYGKISIDDFNKVKNKMAEILDINMPH